MATIPVVWCTDPNSENRQPTAFALRGIQLQGSNITEQHMNALKELVNAASEGRFFLPANGAFMLLDCGLNINSEVTHGAISSHKIDQIKEESPEEEQAEERKVSSNVEKENFVDSFNQYEILYEFLCCAKCMNERLALVPSGSYTHCCDKKGNEALIKKYLVDYNRQRIENGNSRTNDAGAAVTTSSPANDTSNFSSTNVIEAEPSYRQQSYCSVKGKKPAVHRPVKTKKIGGNYKRISVRRSGSGRGARWTRCPQREHHLVSDAPNKEEIERLLYAKVNKLKKKPKNGSLPNQMNELLFVASKCQEDDHKSREADKTTSSNTSSRKNSFDSSCTINSHDSGFIDILNRMDSNNAEQLSADNVNKGNISGGSQTMATKGTSLAKSMDASAINGKHLDDTSNFNQNRNNTNDYNGNTNSKSKSIRQENLKTNDINNEVNQLKSGDPEANENPLESFTNKLECLTQSKNRRKSYEEFRSIFKNEHMAPAKSMKIRFELPNYSGRHLLNPEQISQIKSRRKSYEEFKLMVRDCNVEEEGKEFVRAELARSNSVRFFRKNSQRSNTAPRKTSIFNRAKTDDERRKSSNCDIIYDILPKMQATEVLAKKSRDKDGSKNCADKMEPSPSELSLKCDSVEFGQLMKLKKKLRDSNSNLYDKLISYGTIYDIIQKKNLNYRKYDKYMTYGTIYEILHRKSSLTNQSTYENFNNFNRQKNLSENYKNKSSPKRRTMQRKSLGELIPYFTSFGQKEMAAEKVTETNDQSNESCGTIYDIMLSRKNSAIGENLSESEPKSRFVVERIQEDDLIASEPIASSQPFEGVTNASEETSSDENKWRRRRRFSNILKFDYSPEASNNKSTANLVSTTLEIPSIRITEEGEEIVSINDEHGAENGGDFGTVDPSKCEPAPHNNNRIVANTNNSQLADEGRRHFNISKTHDNYAKINRDTFIEKSSIYKSNSLDMLSTISSSNAPAQLSDEVRDGQFLRIGESTRDTAVVKADEEVAAVSFGMKKNNSDSSLSTKFASFVTSFLQNSTPSLSSEQPHSSSKSASKSDDLKKNESAQHHNLLSSDQQSSATTSNFKLFFTKKNNTRRLSEFTRGEFLNEKP